MIMNAPIYLIYLHFYFINSDLLEYSYAERHLILYRVIILYI